MSTVLPPAAALLLVPLLALLLPLLLQPAAAKAIAAKAAIPVIRLMIFLPQVEIARPPWSALTGLVCAHGPRPPEMAVVAKSLTAAGPRFPHPGEGYQPRPFDGSAATFVQIRPS
jgi:hypothetical protein